MECSHCSFGTSVVLNILEQHVLHEPSQQRPKVKDMNIAAT